MRNPALTHAFPFKPALALLSLVLLAGCAPNNGAFRLSEAPLQDLRDQEFFIPDGNQGYVMFYSNLESCTACLARIALLEPLSRVFPDVGFSAVTTEPETDDTFAMLMAQQNVPGLILSDPKRVIAKRFGLADRPYLLFFNTQHQLLGAMLMDVEQPQLYRQLQRMCNEM